MQSVKEQLILPSGLNLDLLKAELCISWTEIALAINNLSKGSIYARYAATAAPTELTWARGDIVYNSEPSEAGAGGSKYVVTGWICTVGGTPGTWVAMRTLTGS